MAFRYFRTSKCVGLFLTLLFALIFCSCAVFLFKYRVDEGSVPQRKKDLRVELQIALKKAQENEYTILLWEPIVWMKLSSPYTDASQCGKCFITQNKTKFCCRRPDQLYTWYVTEASPALFDYRRLTLKEYDNFFNLTASHRRDSDVYWPYNTLQEIWYHIRRNGLENPQKDVDLVLSNKTGLAIWIVSNCNVLEGAVKRLELVNKLVDADLNVELRGKCFPENEPVPNDKTIIKNYKFYLAFENSYHCADWITEKLFHNGYMMGAVPVVWGAKKSDYLAIAPSHSFIFAEDFPTPASLVKYLNYLDKNDTAYREYFQWRIRNVTEIPQYERQTGFCQLCRIVHGINVDNAFSPNHEKLQADIPMFGYPNKSRIVPSLGKWYYETENIECLPKKHWLKPVVARRHYFWLFEMWNNMRW